MRKPIVEFIRGDLLLISAIGFHAPDLHRAASFRIEVNVLAVRSIVRTVIEAFGGGQSFLYAAVSWHRVNIKFPVPLGTIRDRRAIGRPTMPIRRRQACELARRAA